VLAAGHVQARPGPSLASCDYFTVEIKGQGGHGAMPHLSVDPMTAAANILLGMQTIVAREVPAQDTAVMTIGQIVCGTKGNIIPETATMRGTVRAYDERVREQLKQRLATYSEHVARAYRAEARVRWEGGSCPACVNHEAETAIVHQCAASVLGDDKVDAGERWMPSDDMSLFLNARPGSYFRVGVRPTDNRPHPHHAPEFEMNEDGLEVGLRVALAVMRRTLSSK
jgi:hippurate hydrolase